MAKIRQPKPGNSLLDRFPELCKEWSTNNTLGPEQYTFGSGHKVFWICGKCGHEWKAYIHNRTSDGNQCPSCRKTKCVLTDKNRLSILYPELVAEWDYTKNTDTPNDVSFGSNYKRWWICSKCQNSWLTTIASRAICDRGCKKCNISLGENKIQEYLTEYNIAHIREYRIDECKHKYRLPFDFAILEPSLKLIEYNGQQHYEVQKYWGGIEKFTRTQRNDKIKIDFCQNNNIPLLIISYKDYSRIPQILSEFLLT